jgi:hypothetical protein
LALRPVLELADADVTRLSAHVKDSRPYTTLDSTGPAMIDSSRGDHEQESLVQQATV